jgi:hypothetical protein
MSNKSKIEYLQTIRLRYSKSSKEEKKKMLDEFSTVCEYNRKYAIRLLRKSSLVKTKTEKKRTGPKAKYDKEPVIKFIKAIWIATNLICSKRLKAVISLWLPWYAKEDKKLSKENVELLRKISPATIDRLLSKFRKRYSKRGLCTTKPGGLLRELVPIKTDQWNENRPGYVEVDTVAHCGNSTAGDFVYTLNMVDIATGWTSQRAVWGKGEMGIFQAIRDIESHIPFSILGFDCDNGGELLNWRLLRYFKNRSRPVSYTRSRAYRKNDNSHIEEKNWTIVRQYIGYDRLEKFAMVEMLNDLYRNEMNYFLNFFISSAKLLKKQRIGSKIKKIHEKPKTPFVKLWESEYVDEKTKMRLYKLSNMLNPFELQRAIKQKIKRILDLTIKQN